MVIFLALSVIKIVKPVFFRSLPGDAMHKSPAIPLAAEQ
jgi:hypothetical protein